MMVADTSALMAVLMNEQEHQEFLDAMLNDGRCWYLRPLPLNL